MNDVIEEAEISSETGDRWHVLRLVRCSVDGVDGYAVREECHDDRSYLDFQLDSDDEHSEPRARSAFQECVRLAWGQYKYRD